MDLGFTVLNTWKKAPVSYYLHLNKEHLLFPNSNQMPILLKKILQMGLKSATICMVIKMPIQSCFCLVIITN